MKKLITTLAVITLGIVPVTIAANSAVPIDATEEPPIIQEVKHQGEVIDNHEARITNVEKDVTKLQENTNTPASPNKVTVPAVVTSSPEQLAVAESEPQPITVVTSSYNHGGLHDGHCTLIYSDGSRDYTKATTTTRTEKHPNGEHSQTYMSHNCDSFVGQPKN